MEGFEIVLAALLVSVAGLNALAGDDTIEDVRQHYEQRKRRFAARAGKIQDDGYEDQSRTHQRVLQRLYGAERQAVLALRHSGDISNDVMHRLERELDLEESHLEA